MTTMPNTQKTLARSLAAITAVAALMCDLGAQITLPEKSSADFNYQYEGNVVPSSADPAWIDYQAGSGNSASASGGNLTMTSPIGSYFYYALGSEYWASQINTSIGFTVEWSVRLDAGKQIGLQLALNEGPGVLGAGYATLLISGDKTEWNYGGDDPLQTLTVSTSSNSDDFHIFRLVKLASAGTDAGKFNLYRDGVLLFEDLGGRYYDYQPSDRFFFGSLGDTMDTSAQINYVRWDTSGAFAPIPEPSTLALAGLALVAGLGGLRRLRKQG